MKKVFLFAVAAAALVACSNEELSTPINNEATSGAPVNFSVYTPRALTRAGVAGTNDNTNIGTRGFGVFAYYTAGEQYDAKAIPNFMYNQKVICSGTITDGTGAGLGKWSYEPVKYWPNEFGQKATSDETDYVTFFAYAPWTEVEPTTGNVVAANEKDQKFNIVSVNKNTATGDPMIKYVVDTDPETSVDLLWGVAAEAGTTPYYSGGILGNNPQTITAGLPFTNLVKPNDPVNDLIKFNLKHALAKVKVTIDYVADANTPAEGTTATASTATGNPVVINADQTRIYVRSFKMSGFATKGTLNLNNTTAGEPLWKDFDGVKDLAFDEVVFQDGRKDGKEGETNGAQSNETPQGLNPNIVENYAVITPATAGTPAQPATYALVQNPSNGTTYYTDDQGTSTFVYDDLAPQPAYEKTADAVAAVAGTPAKFGANKTTGVTEKAQNLFGGNETANEGFFYIIPRNEAGGKVDIQIAYDVETIDGALAGKISDGETHGISIENIISKADIFKGATVSDFRAGYQYEIKIHLGMTSVKVDAFVTPWTDNGSTTVNLPSNPDVQP